MELRQHNRRWLDIEKRRLLLGLSVGPLLPGIVGAFLNMSMAMRPDAAELAVTFFGTLILAELWWCGGGLIYLTTVARQRGRTSRTECLLLGTGLGAIAPVVATLTIDAIGAIVLAPPYSFADYFSFILPDILFALVAASIFSCFGLLGGWLLWRIGVRPAGQVPRNIGRAFE